MYVSLQEIVIQKEPGEKLGISIRGGAKGHAGNPFDATDEGIFISKVLKLYTTTLQFNHFFLFYYILYEFEPRQYLRFSFSYSLTIMKQSNLCNATLHLTENCKYGQSWLQSQKNKIQNATEKKSIEFVVKTKF